MQIKVSYLDIWTHLLTILWEAIFLHKISITNECNDDNVYGIITWFTEGSSNEPCGVNIVLKFILRLHTNILKSSTYTFPKVNSKGTAQKTSCTGWYVSV